MARKPEYIGKYKVIEQIATGGMGLVYTAEHPTLERKVIIKKLTMRGDSSVRERFRREAQIMMDFQNDYIVNVHDHFREGSHYHIVLEYVDGLSLEQLIERERYLPEEIALRIFRDCCVALEYAHRRKVVHRDIKPSNILISKRGRVKLVDFGIASIYGDEESTLTREGMTLGTPSYMAPEQFENTRNVDFRADIYSLGVTLYESVTGKRPFSGGMSAEAIRRIQRGRYPAPRSVNPKVSRFVARLIRRSMHRKRQRRPERLSRIVSRVDRRLARMAGSAHEHRLSEFVAGTWSPAAGRSALRRFVPAAAAALVIVLAVAAVPALRAGLHHELLSADEYGALQVAVRIPREGPSPAQAGLRATVYDEQGEVVTGIGPDALNDGAGRRDGDTNTFGLLDPPRLFREEAELGTRSHAAFVSDRLYLPAGDYRVKVSIGGQAHWGELRLLPRTEQRDAEATRQARSLLVVARPWEREEISAELRVRDAVSGVELDDFTVRYDDSGDWVPLEEVMPLESGGTYRFRVTAPGYRRRTVTLEVPVHERRLYIDTTLRPIDD